MGFSIEFFPVNVVHREQKKLMHGDAQISDKIFLIFLIWHNSTSFQVVDSKKEII